jgi:putative acetyltransferase
MQIRKARIEEAQSVIDLHSDTVRRINSRDYSAKQIDMWLGKRKVEITEAMIAGGEYYVAADEQGRILGAGHMKEKKITGLYVSADHQREGIGSAILGQMEKDALANGAEMMEIDSTLTAAPFYQYKGYDEVNRKRVGKAQLDVVVMRKSLKTEEKG